ncbi:MAG: phage tail protein [Pseudomonas fluorescens]
MIDKDSKFLAILTAVGEAKLANAIGLGLPWLLTEMGVGDANDTDPIPDRLQTALIHEQRRAPLNQLRDDPANPGLLIAEQIIPADIGGWWVRELGLYDIDGDLVAVANCAPSYKSLLEQGSGRTQVIRMTFIVSSTANVVLKIDPAVVLATRDYVDDRTYPYVPVQQGDGIGQTSGDVHKIHIGWTREESLKVTVDDVDLGGVVFSSMLQSVIERILGDTPGDLDTLEKLASAVGNDPEFFDAVRAALDRKADEADSLEGYGIHPASEEDAVAGLDNAKPSTSLRVAQYVTKVLEKFQKSLGFAPVQQGGGIGQTDLNKIYVGFGTDSRLKVTVDDTDLGTVVFDSNTAQEDVPGVIKLATLNAVQLGDEAGSAVTPKNMRLGFYTLRGTNNAIVFPSWLASFTFQWGRYSLTANTGAQVAVTFPIPFGAPPHAWAGVDGAATNHIGTAGVTQDAMLVSKGSDDPSPRTGTWFAIGWAY